MRVALFLVIILYPYLAVASPRTDFIEKYETTSFTKYPNGYDKIKSREYKEFGIVFSTLYNEDFTINNTSISYHGFPVQKTIFSDKYRCFYFRDSLRNYESNTLGFFYELKSIKIKIEEFDYNAKKLDAYYKEMNKEANIERYDCLANGEFKRELFSVMFSKDGYLKGYYIENEGLGDKIKISNPNIAQELILKHFKNHISYWGEFKNMVLGKWKN